MENGEGPTWWVSCMPSAWLKGLLWGGGQWKEGAGVAGPAGASDRGCYRCPSASVVLW